MTQLSLKLRTSSHCFGLMTWSEYILFNKYNIINNLVREAPILYKGRHVTNNIRPLLERQVLDQVTGVPSLGHLEF